MLKPPPSLHFCRQFLVSVYGFVAVSVTLCHYFESLEHQPNKRFMLLFTCRQNVLLLFFGTLSFAWRLSNCLRGVVVVLFLDPKTPLFTPILSDYTGMTVRTIYKINNGVIAIHCTRRTNMQLLLIHFG